MSTTSEKLMAICVDLSIGEGAYEKLSDFVFGELQQQKKESLEKIEELADIRRKYENQQKVIKDLMKRHNSKLMSVYYLLNTIKSAGTHHEKAVVITHLSHVCQNLLEHDPLPFNEDMLPF